MTEALIFCSYITRILIFVKKLFINLLHVRCVCFVGFLAKQFVQFFSFHLDVENLAGKEFRQEG